MEETIGKFSDLPLSEEMLTALRDMGFSEMTEVQAKAIVPGLEGKDIIAKAPTGTGKTCAFGIPIVEKLADDLQPQAVIMAPTRELAMQITEELCHLAAYKKEVRIVCLYGGQNIEKQIKALKRGAQIVVATPGRLLDHMQRRTIDLSGIHTVVLDEADEMLDMGFYKDVRRILDSLKNKKQVWMFSATISREVMDIGWLYQRDAVEITVLPVEKSMPKIEQFSLNTTGRNKLADLTQIIVSKGYTRVMVFCNTKFTTSMLCDQLCEHNFSADCLHGDMSQHERNKIMQQFRSGEFNILVATDVAARGIDISDIEVVINYDMPDSNEYYLHRIGRTGRAKRSGVSYLLVTPDEVSRVRSLVRFTRSELSPLKFDENRQLVPDPNTSFSSGVELIKTIL